MEDFDDYQGPEDTFNEYGDLDAISCANGDYNAWEEEQVFQDRAWDDDDYSERDYDDDDDDYDYHED